MLLLLVMLLFICLRPLLWIEINLAEMKRKTRAIKMRLFCVLLLLLFLYFFSHFCLMFGQMLLRTEEKEINIIQKKTFFRKLSINVCCSAFVIFLWLRRGLATDIIMCCILGFMFYVALCVCVRALILFRFASFIDLPQQITTEEYFTALGRAP